MDKNYNKMNNMLKCKKCENFLDASMFRPKKEIKPKCLTCINNEKEKKNNPKEIKKVLHLAKLMQVD